MWQAFADIGQAAILDIECSQHSAGN
jgi:hypothetical protein